MKNASCFVVTAAVVFLLASAAIAGATSAAPLGEGDDRSYRLGPGRCRWEWPHPVSVRERHNHSQRVLRHLRGLLAAVAHPWGVRTPTWADRPANGLRPAPLPIKHQGSQHPNG
jgi:hypothetical protein